MAVAAGLAAESADSAKSAEVAELAELAEVVVNQALGGGRRIIRFFEKEDSP